MVSLRGVVASGLGQGAQFMAVPWVREGIRRLIGFDPYSGTLNVRLVDPDALVAWRRIREGFLPRSPTSYSTTCAEPLPGTWSARVSPSASPWP